MASLAFFNLQRRRDGGGSSSSAGSRAGSRSSSVSSMPKTSSSSSFKWYKPSTWGLPSKSSAPKPAPKLASKPRPKSNSPPSNPLSKAGTLPPGFPFGDNIHHDHHHTHPHHQDHDYSKPAENDTHNYPKHPPHHRSKCDVRCRNILLSVLGGIALLVLFVVLICCCVRRRRGSKKLSRHIEEGSDGQSTEARGVFFEMSEKMANSAEDKKPNGGLDGMSKPPSYDTSPSIALTVGEVSKVTPFFADTDQGEVESESPLPIRSSQRSRFIEMTRHFAGEHGSSSSSSEPSSSADIPRLEDSSDDVQQNTSSSSSSGGSYGQGSNDGDQDEQPEEQFPETETQEQDAPDVDCKVTVEEIEQAQDN